MQRGTELPVRGVGKEPLPQDLERLPEAVAQLVPRPRSLLPADLPPHLQRARLRRVVGAPEARLVGEEPERGEIGVQVLREDPAEVRSDPRRTRETCVVARDAQREPVRREAPERRAGGVQGLLQESEGAPPAPVVSELRQGGVQARSRRGGNDGNPVAEGEEPDRIHPFVDRRRLRVRERREAERVAQKRLQEAFRKGAGVASGSAARLHLPKARLGDAPAPGDLVADVEPVGNVVVRRLLRGGVELRHLSKPLGPEKTAFDRERVEGDPSLARATSTRRHGQSHPRQKHVHADHVRTREGVDGGAPGRPAGLAHPEMVVQQCPRTRCRELLQVRLALLEQGEGSCRLALAHMPRGIAGGRVREQRECFGPGDRSVGSRGDPGQCRRLLDHQRRLPAPRAGQELVAQPEERDGRAATHALRYPAADAPEDRRVPGQGVAGRGVAVVDRKGPTQQRVGEHRDEGMAALDGTASGRRRIGEVDGDRARDVLVVQDARGPPPAAVPSGP